ncbi:MAG: dATP pyrophosphohydrolase [Rhodobacteraceae bacterium]|nr:MAG: dATP pyrophosphohydrolase [Paracoccaceae bacterium]
MVLMEYYDITISLMLLTLMLLGFFIEPIPTEVTALTTAFLMIIFGVLPSQEFLSILSNPAPWTIMAMFVLSGALVRTGLLNKVGEFISSNTKTRPNMVIVLLAIITIASSAFMNNTPVVVVLIPIVMKLASEMNSSASKYLIPLSYLAIMGGMLTLIGTSTNLLIDGVAQTYNLQPFGMFEITPVAGVLALFGIAYLFLFSPLLLPNRTSMTEILCERDQMSFLTEVVIPKGSQLIDQISNETTIFNRDGMRIIEIIRNEESLGAASGNLLFKAGDKIVLRTQMGELMGLKESTDLRMIDPLTPKQTITVETLIPPGCRLVGRTLGQLRLRRSYGVYVLAIHRRNKNIDKQLENVVVRVGDTLLIEGARDEIQKLALEVDLALLAEPNIRAYRRKHAPLVISALVGMVLLTTFGLAPLFILALAGVVFVLCTKCIDIEEAYEFIDGKILVLVFSMLAIGKSLELTGVIRSFTELIQPYLQLLPIPIILWLLYLFTSVLTEIVSNNAVAVVITPIAISLASSLGLDPRAFVMVIMIAASASFATPIGYQTNTMVYGPGGYKFTDFLRVGLPLNLLFGMLTAILIFFFYIGGE